MQLAKSEWFQVVQMQDFENLYNAEIRSNQYCCCDNPDVQCGNYINAVNSITCNTQNSCKPYYVLRVKLQGCPSTDTTCSISEPTDCSAERTFVTTSVLPHFHVTLNQSELELYNQVRT